jgi:polysaccharide pyruvyl transferase WcaK-like protein
MNKLVMYGHGGSGNHGCEAIVRSTLKTVENINKAELFSNRAYEDVKYGLNKICNVESLYYKMKNPLIEKKILGIKKVIIGKHVLKMYRNRGFYKACDKNTVALSIGGDNYCYPYAKTRKLLPVLNSNAKKKGTKLVLWGCSIEPNLVNEKMVEELKKYDLITARETLTYNVLVENGLEEKVILSPDPAFQLNKIDSPLPKNFIENNTIGLNISPLIQRREKTKGITLKNFSKLIDYIIVNTDMNIALIPHVIWKHDNDLKPLKHLFNLYKDSERVVLIEDTGCREIKGFISRLRMFIGGRTHATIGAYSTNIPTLTVGYSVKAKGIAKDLFGTEENMVLPVQTLNSEDDVINAFKYLYDNEESIRSQLKKITPKYCEDVKKGALEVDKLLN